MAKANSKKAKGTSSPSMLNSSSLPQAADIPKGMKQLGGSFSPTWTPTTVGDSIHGIVSDLPKDLILNEGTKKENKARVMEVTDMGGARHAIWDSAVLNPLFNAIEESGEIGQEIYIRYDGLGVKKGKNNPPKLFTVAMAE